jgi:hypothetical protein
MSALGHKQTFAVQKCGATRDVRLDQACYLIDFLCTVSETESAHV